MKTFEVSFARLFTFRCQVHASFIFRRDALFEIAQAIPLLPQITAAVYASLAPVFRRRFASVYNALRHGRIDRSALRAILVASQPDDAVKVAGYEVHAIDTTNAERPDAKTLQDRGQLYSTSKGKAIPGHKFSWLGRIIAFGQSWFAPLEMDRIPTDSTAAEVGANQVKALAASASPQAPKVVTADSSYAVPTFLQVFVNLLHVFLLVRLAGNRVLFRTPPPSTGKRGRPRLHGDKISLHDPPPADHCLKAELLGHAVILSAWVGLHLQKTPQLAGMLICVQFLKPDGSPRYKSPLWLFWTGPQDVPLTDLAQMYLMRFTIEHFFRFLKQRLGLLAFHTTDVEAQSLWMWLVLLAYWQLLLARTLVRPRYHPWDPAGRQEKPASLTPGQVLAGWPVFSAGLDTPAAPPKPSGKSPGRVVGFHPKPRTKYPVVRKKPIKATSKT